MGVVLLVDEDPQVHELALRSLVAAGHVVIEAADGPRALAQVVDARPDVIVTDRMVKRPEDEELINALRRGGCTPETTQLVYVGGRPDSQPCRFDHPPVAACLPKRVTSSTLQSVVKVLLGGPGPH